ncbi:hypothetical protein FHS18_003016 [Paenibacillus phyllosphaerae]|uniref:Uncharacterized protein n=1 Tax=Paenibacillus phyllosphaerae TaxID=274593 RepID=A0A7W5AY99_9BACL|nr:hypothetical protein [Paenibacillus phyllosphaerae]MBB3110948.1 hypothetical protein [Paenibacillus phyllosphaerae]
MKEEAVQPPVVYRGSFLRKALINSLITAIVIFVSVYLGSEQFHHVDLALIGYLVATVLCLLFFTMRITAWSLRPPTRRLWRQGFEMMTSAKGLKFLFHTLGTNIGTQKFIVKRSWFRGAQHLLISWGVLFSFGITFALVLNWMHFELVAPTTYEVVMFGIPLFRMGVESWLAIALYHGLNWTGIAVIAGCAMAMIRRVYEKNRLVEQRDEYDLFPLVLLMAISITGSLLTVSALWMEGEFYYGISLSHEIVVIVFLLYMPFSKFWHIPLRFLAVVIPAYHGLAEQKKCARCGVEYATSMQIQDVQTALSKRDLSVPIEHTPLHMSDLCSQCRRISNRLSASRMKVGLAQAGVWVQGNGHNGLTALKEGEPLIETHPEH